MQSSSESLQGLSSSASCSAPTTSAASRPKSKQKSTDCDDLGVDDPKQVRLSAYPVSMFEVKKLRPRKDASMLRGIRGGIGLDILSSLMQLLAFFVEFGIYR